ncbi:MAG: hypothetical protein AMXMBFR13_21990 [Phycisphaerae bacterium]
MAIDPRTERLARIVHVEARDALQPDDLVEVGHRPGIAFRRTQLISGCERVAGVEADAQPFRLAHLAENVGDVRESMPDAGPLPGGDFQQNAGGETGRLLMNQVDRLADAADAGDFTDPHVASRVRNQSADAQRLAARQFVQKSIYAAPPDDFVRCGQIDEIGVMGYDRIQTGLGPGFAPELQVFITECGRLPLPLVLNEHLQHLAPGFDRPVEGRMQPAGNGYMRAEAALAVRDFRTSGHETSSGKKVRT